MENEINSIINMIAMKDFELLNQALSEIKGGLTDLYESSIIDASEDRTCTTFCTENCSDSVGSTTGTTKGVIIDKPIQPIDPTIRQ